MNTLRGLVVVMAGIWAVSRIFAETTVSLDIAFGIRYVPPANVAVPVGEYLRILAPTVGAGDQWTKDGRPIPGATNPVLIIPSAAASDAGVYQYTWLGLGIPERGSQLLFLNVGPGQRFVNLSTRAFAGTSDQTLIGGFVITGPGEKKVLLRAVGPSLAKFGLTGFLQDPVITIYDSAGAPYRRGFVYPAVIGAEERAIADATQKVGAFPLLPGARDGLAYQPFDSGAYTVHVKSEAGSTGIVLLEIYEVP